MFAYLIIAIELAILYSVFWFVFIREPKPYRVTSNLWGTYEGANPNYTTGNIKSEPMDQCYAMATRTVSRRPRHQAAHCVNHTAQQMKYGWVVADPRPSGNLLARTLNCLKRSLEVLCVKLP
ncbi:MAG TPA: hypothetical protein V6C72_16210 [Chroococcales cyanobacterium]